MRAKPRPDAQVQTIIQLSLSGMCSETPFSSWSNVSASHFMMLKQQRCPSSCPCTCMSCRDD